MAHWSTENATKAYLRAVKMGKRSKEPDAAEFISALAAGNNAQLMVVIGGSATLALIAAAHQTGGRVVCMCRDFEDLHKLKNELGAYANKVEFLMGDARTLLLTDYKGADFVVINCEIDDHKGVFLAAQRGAKNGGAVIVGYNALSRGSWGCGLMTHFLPIGNGLLVTKIPPMAGKTSKRSRWIVKVDECTGEEHVFRITSPRKKVVALLGHLSINKLMQSNGRVVISFFLLDFEFCITNF